eukprot:gene5981-12061_t
MDTEEVPVTARKSVELQAEEESKIRAAQDLFGGSGQNITRAEKERLDQEAAVQAKETKNKELESKRRANLDQISQKQHDFQEAVKMKAEKVATAQLALQKGEENKKTVTQRLKERSQEQDRRAFEAEVEKRRLADLLKITQRMAPYDRLRSYSDRKRNEFANLRQAQPLSSRLLVAAHLQR